MPLHRFPSNRSLVMRMPHTSWTEVWLDWIISQIIGSALMLLYYITFISASPVHNPLNTRYKNISTDCDCIQAHNNHRAHIGCSCQPSHNRSPTNHRHSRTTTYMRSRSQSNRLSHLRVPTADSSLTSTYIDHWYSSTTAIYIYIWSNGFRNFI